MLVNHELGFALARLLDDRNDLVVEPALILGSDSAAMGFDRQRVLILAADAELSCDVFSRHAHVHAPERIRERAHHHVDRGGIAHAGAPALGLR